MVNSNKKILKIYACGTIFCSFIGTQNNLAEDINSNTKNRGELILQQKIEKIRNKVEEFKKEVEEIENNRKDNNTINQGSLQQYKEKKDKKCREIQEKIEESLNEAEMLEWKGFEGLELYKEAKNREIKINKNIQEVKNLQNAIDNAIEKEVKKNKKENKIKTIKKKNKRSKNKKESEDIKNNKKIKKTKKTKELLEEEKKKIDKKEIKKRERKIEGYKREIENLKGKINENLKKEEEINTQKEKESAIFGKKINKEKEIARKKAQILGKENNKKVSDLEKNLENLKKKKVNKKDKKKIQKNIEEKKTEIAKLKKKTDNILLNNEKSYDEKIKKFNNTFSVKIEKIKALNIKIQNKIAELENLIDVIQREIDIISENGYEYFIKYSKKEQGPKDEDILGSATEEKKEENLPENENGKKDEKFDFISKNKVFGIKNSSILIDSNFSIKHDLYNIKKWKFFDKSYSIMAKGDFYLNFNRAKENKIYKKLKFSVDFYWMKDLNILKTFWLEAFELQTLYKKGLIKKIETKYYFYDNEKIKMGFKTGYRGLPFLKDFFGNKSGDMGLFIAVTTKIKRIKTSFEGGIDINLHKEKMNAFIITSENVCIKNRRMWKRSISPVILTKTKLKYFDLNSYFSIFSFSNRIITAHEIFKHIIFRADFKFKNIKYFENTLVKIYFGDKPIISSLNRKEFMKECKEYVKDELFMYYPIVGISITNKICLDKMNIFKILGFEKFKCKLNLIVEYMITAKFYNFIYPKGSYNQVLGKLDLNIGILKLKESRFKKLGKFQLNIFNFVLERTSEKVKFNGKAFFNRYIFDVLVLKYNILKGLSLSLHLFKFEMQCVFKNELDEEKSKENPNSLDAPINKIYNLTPPSPVKNSFNSQIKGNYICDTPTPGQGVMMPPMWGLFANEAIFFESYWVPSLEIKFDVAKYLLSKKKK